MLKPVRKSLKVHYCRYVNLRISSYSSHKNNIPTISHNIFCFLRYAYPNRANVYLQICRNNRMF